MTTMHIGTMSGLKKTRGASIQERIMEWSTPIPESGCWIWLGGCAPQGHGSSFHNGKPIMAHRASWLAFRGAIPESSHVLHKCDVPCCVNPNHLYLGDHAQNMRDVKERGRRIGKCAGEDNWNSRLNNEAVRKIRKRYTEGGVTQNALAKEYAVPQTLISAIVLRKAWKHVK